MSTLAEAPSSAERSLLFGAGLLALRKDDYLLAGFPRSGSTWTRHVLCNLISLNEWNGREVESILNATMPALGATNLFRPWPHRTIPRVIKTHHRYSPLFRSIPSISIIRDPRDVMVSRYHLIRDKRDEFGEPFGRFIRDRRHGLENWFRHYTSWRPHARLELRYEEMLADPHREFTRLLGTLGVTSHAGMLDEAIVRSSFESLQSAEKQRKPSVHEDGLFFRSGSSGQWHGYFDEDDRAYYLGLATKYDVRAYP
jgi:estrone sulfotransferase